MENPLQLIAKELNLNNLMFGFPLKVDTRDGSVSFPKRTWINFILITLISQITGGIFIFWNQTSPQSFHELMKKYYETAGVDMSTWYILMFSNVTCTMSFFAAFFLGRSKAKAISDIFIKIRDAGDLGTNSLQEPLGRVTKNKMRNHLAVGSITTLASIVIFFFYMYAFTEDFLLEVSDSNHDKVLSYATVVFSVISFFITYLNPITRGISFLSLYMIGCTGECFDTLRESLLLREKEAVEKALSRSSKPPPDGRHGSPAPPPSYEEIVARGKISAQLVGDLNGVLSPMILFLYSIYLSLVTAYSYITLVPLLGGKVQRILGSMSGFSFFLFVLHVFGLYSLCCSGQELEEKRKAARYVVLLLYLTRSYQYLDTHVYRTCRLTLENWLASEQRPGVDTSLWKEAKMLVALLEDNDGAPISPYSAFRINHSGFLGMIATIATYVVVLVQFKVAGRGGQQQQCPETIAQHNDTTL